jgi:hypothetical protein
VVSQYSRELGVELAQLSVWNGTGPTLLSLHEWPFVVDVTNPECQMSKRKPSKHSHTPKIAAKAQRAAQAVVRSSKVSVPRAVSADTNEPPPMQHEVSQEDDLLVKNPQLRNSETRFKDNIKQTAENDSKKSIDFLASTNASVHAYQGMLLELAQANIQFGSQFAQRLATIRSPLEFFSVVAEFTNKRIATFQNVRKKWLS